MDSVTTKHGLPSFQTILEESYREIELAKSKKQSSSSPEAFTTHPTLCPPTSLDSRKPHGDDETNIDPALLEEGKRLSRPKRGRDSDISVQSESNADHMLKKQPKSPSVEREEPEKKSKRPNDRGDSRCMSCLNCRKRKMKCSRTYPTCVGCSMRDELCNWAGAKIPETKGAPISVQKVKEVEAPVAEQLRELRSLVDTLVKKCEEIEAERSAMMKMGMGFSGMPMSMPMGSMGHMGHMMPMGMGPQMSMSSMSSVNQMGGMRPMPPPMMPSMMPMMPQYPYLPPHMKPQNETPNRIKQEGVTASMSGFPSLNPMSAMNGMAMEQILHQQRERLERKASPKSTSMPPSPQNSPKKPAINFSPQVFPAFFPPEPAGGWS